MGKHLVLVGGGHAHMVTLSRLHKFISKGYRVTVIGPSEYHYYSGMGPGMLAKTYTPEEIRFATRRVVEKQGCTFILDGVVKIDPEEKTLFLKSGNSLSYDTVSFNSGSYVPAPFANKKELDVFSVKPIQNLIKAQQRIVEIVNEKKATFAIVGGGPASAEIAGNIWRLAKDYGKNQPEIIIFSGEKLLARFSEKVRKMVFTSLMTRGIKVFESAYVREVSSGTVALTTGEDYPADLIFLATGVKPSPLFKTSGIPAESDGGMLVNQYLQSVKYPEIFGGGDCISFAPYPLNKVGVYAVRQNPVLFFNLMASLQGKRLRPFIPAPYYLLIFNMGDDSGVFTKKDIVFNGKTAYFIKDYVDQKFMRQFKKFEE